MNLGFKGQCNVDFPMVKEEISMQSHEDFVSRVIFVYPVTSVQEIGKNMIFYSSTSGLNLVERSRHLKIIGKH